jgi:hypothetical protein
MGSQKESRSILHKPYVSFLVVLPGVEIPSLVSSVEVCSMLEPTGILALYAKEYVADRSNCGALVA